VGGWAQAAPRQTANVTYQAVDRQATRPHVAWMATFPPNRRVTAEPGRGIGLDEQDGKESGLGNTFSGRIWWVVEVDSYILPTVNILLIFYLTELRNKNVK